MKRTLFIFCFVGNLVAAPTVQLSITNRQQKSVERVTAGTVLHMIIALSDAQGLTCEPDMHKLSTMVTSRGVQTVMTIRNGQQQMTREWHYDFVPDTVGTMIVGPIQLHCTNAVYQTNAVKIVVEPATASRQNETRAIDSQAPLRGSWIIPDGKIIQGQVVPVTLLVESINPVVQVQMPNIQFSGFTVVHRTEPIVTTVQSDGTERTQASMTFHLQPIKSGVLMLPAATAIVRQMQMTSIFGFFGLQQAVDNEVSIATQSVTVESLPTKPPVDYVGIVQEAKIATSATSIDTNQAAKITCTITGSGVPLHIIEPVWPDNIKVYPGKKTSIYDKEQQRYVSTYEWVVQPTVAQDIVVPNKQLVSYDPVAKKISQHTIQGVAIKVVQGAIQQHTELGGDETAVPEHDYLERISQWWIYLAALLQQLAMFLPALWIIAMPGIVLLILVCIALVRALSTNLHTYIETWLAWLCVVKSALVGAKPQEMYRAWQRYYRFYATRDEDSLNSFFANPAWRTYVTNLEQAAWGSAAHKTRDHLSWVLRCNPIALWFGTILLSQNHSPRAENEPFTLSVRRSLGVEGCIEGSHKKRSCIRMIINKFFALFFVFAVFACNTLHAQGLSMPALYRAWQWPEDAASFMQAVQHAGQVVRVWDVGILHTLWIRMIFIAPWWVWLLAAMLLSLLTALFLIVKKTRTFGFIVVPLWAVIAIVIGGREYQKNRTYAMVTRASAAKVYALQEKTLVPLFDLPQYAIVSVQYDDGQLVHISSTHGKGVMQQRDLTLI